MTQTYTYTVTGTFARAELLKMQFTVALRRTFNASQNEINIIQTGINNRWIRTVKIYGIDVYNLCRAELSLDIDWDEYSHQLQVGRATVTVDARWRDNTAIEVDEAISLFNSTVQGNTLRVVWQVVLADAVNRDAGIKAGVMRALGLVDTTQPTWTGKLTGVPLSVQELPEFKLNITLSGS